MFSEQFSIQDLIDNGLIIAHKDGNYGSNYPKKSEFNDHGVLFLTAKNLDDSGNIDFSSAQRLNVEKAKELTFGYIESGDVLLSHNATVGRVALVPDLDEPVLIGTSLTYFRINDNELNPRYFAGFLSSRDFQNQLKAVMSFSTRNQVPITLQRILNVSLPALDEQKKMSDFISSFEHKLELNQKMNKILEKIAKTLFKSWFIDFDPVRAKAEGRPTGLSKEISDLFPDSFEDSELGEIPKGWRIESFSNITSFKNGFAFKSKDWTESGKPVVKIGNVKPLILDIDGCSFISDDIKKYDEYLLSKGDILIGMTGYVGETCLVPKLDKMPYQNQRVGKLIPTKDFFKEFIFSFTRQSNFKKKVEEIAKGSAQQNVSGKDILGLHFVFGNEEILKIFSDSTSDLFKKILLNFEENITLAKVRDTLLPKLISGELKILDAENLIEEAGI